MSVPNCERPSAVMWITCQHNPDMLRFNIARGSNLCPTYHGLLGWYTILLVLSFNPIIFYCQSFHYYYSNTIERETLNHKVHIAVVTPPIQGCGERGRRCTSGAPLTLLYCPLKVARTFQKYARSNYIYSLSEHSKARTAI